MLDAAARGRFVNACATTYSPSALELRNSPTIAWSARNVSTGESDPRRLLRPNVVIVRRDGIGPATTFLGKPWTAIPSARNPPTRLAPAQIVITMTTFAVPSTYTKSTNAA